MIIVDVPEPVLPLGHWQVPSDLHRPTCVHPLGHAAHYDNNE